MKRVVIVAVALAVPVLAATPSTQSASVVVCHRTTSDERPYVRLTIPLKRLPTHRNHAADVIPAPRSCPGSILTPFHGGRELMAPLAGGPGADPVASGAATIRLRAGQAQLCAVVAVEHLSYQPTVGVHLHRVAEGGARSTVAFFRGLGTNDRLSSSCVRVPRAVVAQILRTPAAFEVEVHTPDFQSGAVRGRLGPPGLPPPPALGTLLTGAAVCTSTCAAGDPDGIGFAYVRLTPLVSAGSVCFSLSVAPSVSTPALSAHIHRGMPGRPGPAVVELVPPLNGRSMGCATVDHRTYDEILTRPADFYVDVHNAEYPDGAVRGQLPAR